jgi:hypothetical protein
MAFAAVHESGRVQAVFTATNFIVGRWTALAIASVAVVLLPLRIGAHILCRHQPGASMPTR